MERIWNRLLQWSRSQAWPASQGWASPRSSGHWSYSGADRPGEVGQAGEGFRRLRAGQDAIADRHPGRRGQERRPAAAVVQLQALAAADHRQRAHDPGQLCAGQHDLGRGQALRAGPVPLPQAERGKDQRQGPRHGGAPRPSRQGRQARRRRGPARRRQGERADQDAVEQPAADEGQGERRRRGEDQRARAAPARQRLLHVRRLADDPAVQRGRHMVRAEDADADLGRRDRPIRQDLIR